MKHLKLLLLLFIPFIVISCSLLEEDPDCSKVETQTAYDEVLNTYSESLNQSDCSVTKEAIENSISFINDNRSCIETALTAVDSTYDAAGELDGKLSELNESLANYDECIATGVPNGDLVLEECTPEAFEMQMKKFEDAFAAALIAEDCDKMKGTLTNLKSFLDNNKECAISIYNMEDDEASNPRALMEDGEDEFNEFYNEIDGILTALETSNCDPDVISDLMEESSTLTCDPETTLDALEGFEKEFNNAYDDDNCTGMQEAILKTATYIEDNKGCFVEVFKLEGSDSPENEVDEQIALLKAAAATLQQSNCDPAVIDQLGLFSERPDIEDLSCPQVLNQFKKLSVQIDAAINDDTNCHLIILTGEKVLELYEHHSDCIIEKYADENQVSIENATIEVQDKMDEIETKIEEKEANCN
ncbi:hypothetical protein [Flammeovirga kamogawensis]|uniref:Uncharacterized protein n=1 Tax=Flammeovirga kamogawensis TaxID=373891 RepID=A0ABX8GYC9_9BACT|nr:hypothetical protein [Flammeovirga kamogawensis]MBB6462876.1 soluble cytochrome b562 [Flammeovirga kamogawensis]QWG08342.1 hypothetical protein KM029_05245 [Flammeovirga kamogawensis]TRX66639.1 hypothetical protein EO216_00305 [Flammeovirga kamogawensis]